MRIEAVGVQFGMYLYSDFANTDTSTVRVPPFLKLGLRKIWGRGLMEVAMTLYGNAGFVAVKTNDVDDGACQIC